MRRTHCRQAIVERSSLYFWSIWEQHVFSFIIVHLQTKIYEVLKRASVHLAVVVHYSTDTTTNSASLDWNYLLVEKRVEKKSLLLSFQWETKKKEFSCLCYRGRRFFTGSGAPLCYSNGSPSITTTTDCTH